MLRLGLKFYINLFLTKTLIKTQGEVMRARLICLVSLLCLLFAPNICGAAFFEEIYAKAENGDVEA